MIEAPQGRMSIPVPNALGRSAGPLQQTPVGTSSHCVEPPEPASTQGESEPSAVPFPYCDRLPMRRRGNWGVGVDNTVATGHEEVAVGPHWPATGGPCRRIGGQHCARRGIQ